ERDGPVERVELVLDGAPPRAVRLTLVEHRLPGQEVRDRILVRRREESEVLREEQQAAAKAELLDAERLPGGRDRPDPVVTVAAVGDERLGEIGPRPAGPGGRQPERPRPRGSP